MQTSYEEAAVNELATQVDQMISDHLPFGEIEDRIEVMRTPEDQKAALWLLAWSSQPPSVRRTTVQHALSFVETRG
jgi:hypothetical protein